MKSLLIITVTGTLAALCIWLLYTGEKQTQSSAGQNATTALRPGIPDTTVSAERRTGTLKRKLPPPAADGEITVTLADTLNDSSGVMVSVTLSPSYDSLRVDYSFPVLSTLIKQTDTLATVVLPAQIQPPFYEHPLFTLMAGVVAGILLAFLLTSQ